MRKTARHDARRLVCGAVMLIAGCGGAPDPRPDPPGMARRAFRATGFPIANAPLSLAIGDFNRDGRADLAVLIHGKSLGLLLLRGSGDGQFTNVPGPQPPAWPDTLAAADLNRDGNVDLVLSSQGTLSTFLGNGDFTFGQRSDAPLAGSGFGIALADFDRDGRLDVAVAGYEGRSADPLVFSTADVFLGRGDGTFQPQVAYLAGSFIRGIAAADIDGDGAIDLALGNGENDRSVGGEVLLLWGAGDGRFTRTMVAPLGPFSGLVAAGDFDEDGHADLAVGQLRAHPDGSSESSIAVLLGRGDRRLARMSEPPVDHNVFAVAVADLDGDAHLDLVVLDSLGSINGADQIDLFYGDGHAHFSAPQRLPLDAAGGSMAIGDLDGNGTPDLVVTEPDNARGKSDAVRVFLNFPP